MGQADQHRPPVAALSGLEAGQCHVDMATLVEYISFLARLWREASSDVIEPSPDWHSKVEHIQSGQGWSLCGLDESLGLLRQQAEDPGALRAPQGE